MQFGNQLKSVGVSFTVVKMGREDDGLKEEVEGLDLESLQI